jgi:DNA-directed RNA polymerase II subunit RPB2
MEEEIDNEDMIEGKYNFKLDEITNQEDVWEVITKYFEEKGLVRQQLESFNYFIKTTMQELVDEQDKIEIELDSKKDDDEDRIVFFTFILG